MINSIKCLLPIIKSSSFKIIAIFTGCFLIGGGLITGVSGYYSQETIAQQTKTIVFNERNEAISKAEVFDTPHLKPIISDLVQHEPGFYYLLQDHTKQVITGNMLHLNGVEGWRWLTWTHRTFPPDRHPVIGYGTTLSDGGYFFVGLDATPVQSLRHHLWISLGWNSLLFLICGLCGGGIISRIVLKKIENISQTARDIMNGDISKRLTSPQTHDEFDHLIHSLNAMLERNECYIKNVQQITDDIAHDMRRPLSKIDQYLDIAISYASSKSEELPLIHAKENLQEALEIFSSLLRMAQLESEKKIPNAEEISVNILFQNIHEMYSVVAEEKQQHLIFNELKQQHILYGNKVLLIQMMANLIENSINYSPEKTTISISHKIAKDKLIFSVSDNGPGIPEEEHERVFEKMVRLNPSQTIPGTGLGLSLVKAIAKIHGGTVHLHNNGPGLCCEVHFPYPSLIT
nr:HAMP domain-containing sensor histidine kinase [uncultured Neokomagataea sp.]